MAEWQCRRVRTIDGGIMKRRVVVTGLGAITPIGNDVESFSNLLSPRSTVALIFP